MPVNDFSGQVIGVAQAINKTSVREEPFNEQDEKVGHIYIQADQSSSSFIIIIVLSSVFPCLHGLDGSP